MVARPSTCLRRLAGGRRSGIVGFSRFLANPRVTVAALLDGWGAEHTPRCAGRHILAIQSLSRDDRIAGQTLTFCFCAGLVTKPVSTPAFAGAGILSDTLQDSSEFNFTTTRARSRGLGEIGKGSGRGVLLRGVLGVDAETGGNPGLAKGWVWRRAGYGQAMAG